MASDSARAALLLSKQLKDLQKNGASFFSAGLVDDENPFEWQIILTGPASTLYEGGMFKARLTFPKDYPYKPPVMKFVSEMWHPNIYKDGKVCISILHPAGDDPNAYEMASERWLPVHTVESILNSVISLLASPNTESPANVDAAKQMREEPDNFKRRVRRTVDKTLDEAF
uniref:E2 ubiquitin-conjugating enzyme n=1 Tax=Rhodosorus marinus TaxID=101924 RepID=A0A7S3EGA2_9RHOD|mmetsp:Transcript_31852/g.123623  ORF Transcript_31852/g.123623 Transcript_31852/m.123623 type:complete len:171 (+) Transcript_31852:390-902(+)|eukprot:CAMPEP_0113961992 /NCGR_PEP_ID=MMETSP0011_2-20120614/5649_1 /TAXON_ID=101924 /ORGANISM="Rhodosorus marinus" /LENGTH=170 /DNA_ID=CAMNT_0000973759 /DNA_START=279 /DNA_END=791 /DNA_ORIENTATION=- /assembly_acc=CAM_ASM_000156